MRNNVFSDSRILFSVAVMLVLMVAGAASAESITRQILESVGQHADTVLSAARDRFGEEPTPLLADAVDMRVMAPARRKHRDREFIISNAANQQNFLRVLLGLSNITGDDGYRREATALVRFHLEYLRSDCGLLHWGGHRAFDLLSRKFVTREIHELKHNFPFYELLWEVDPQATETFIKAFWNAHIMDWSILDMNRHGSYNRPMGDLWESPFTGAPPFFEGRGLTFVNTGDDLIYAALMLHALAGDEGALIWGMRLARQYVNARHPKTGLGVYQYSQAKRRAPPPEDENAPDFTYSRYGDRTQRQFGPEFGEVALEGYYLPGERSIYSLHSLMQLQMAEMLGAKGEAMRDWTIAGMRAYGRHAYNSEDNTLTPMFADGTSLENYRVRRKGYHGPAGRVITAGQAPLRMFHAYCVGYRMTGDKELRDVARGIALGHGLGDIGQTADAEAALALNTDNADPLAIFGLLALHKRDGNRAYLDVSKRVARNIMDRRYHKGMFAGSGDDASASIDAIEPLALLTLAAELREEPEKVPVYRAGRAYFSP